MSTIISVEHLTKTYRLGAIGGATLQEDFSRWWARMRGHADPMSKVGQGHHARRVGEQFWALDDVSFDVGEGEVLGVIGRNGAGKSTLLKVLSQVTAPTSGQVVLRGRVASLLEVGTGFHPELTGRENVYLNGAILGMTKVEIRRKFDEIVDFSECGGFIDTPVKRYSSGMYVRLAFAVAAHLEPEILIVDEVLAVGDTQFQNKCLGKMGEVSRGGRTVLFVSHNMGAVQRLCRKAVLLDGGKVSLLSDSSVAIAQYLKTADAASAYWAHSGEPKALPIYFTEIKVTNPSGEVANSIASTDTVSLNLKLHVSGDAPPSQIVFRITNHEGIPVFTSANTDVVRSLVSLPAGRYVYRIDIPANFLAAGSYQVLVASHIPRVTLFDRVEHVAFRIEDTAPNISEDRLGVVTPRLTWQGETQCL